MNKKILTVFIVLIFLVGLGISQVKDDPTKYPCGIGFNLSTTTYLVDKMNITYSTCIPSGSNVLMICNGFQSARRNTTLTKTITVTKIGAKKLDFQTCRIYDFTNEKIIPDTNITSRVTG